MIDVAKLRFNQTPVYFEAMNTHGQPTHENALSLALAELYGRINYERQVKVSANGFRLQNMRELLRRMGNPQSDFPAIHVAGTKGKGSVSTMVGSILTKSGFRTGVYTSPHLEKINQRMAINGQVISDAQLLNLLLQMQPVVKEMDQEAADCGGPTLTFFEITTAAAMLFFSQESVDFAVLEVGLGGRLDSTNVCEPVACVITNISLDHTKQLGKTIDKIAREKAGIIKPNVPVVNGSLEPDAVRAIEEIASERSARLYQMGDDFQVQPNKDTSSLDFTFQNSSSFTVTGKINDRRFDLKELKLSLPGVHQRNNAAIAVATTKLLDDPDQRITPKSIRDGLAKASLPGRTEIVSTEPLVILDIAHNPASITALAETLMHEMPGWRNARTRKILFATSRDKDASAMLHALSGTLDELWLTEYQTNPRAFPLDKVYEQAKRVVTSSIQTSASPAQAWRSMLDASQPDDAICITGSAFLIAELRPILIEWTSKSS
jgi:dihydrofolate synthase/folylpolyglutamate synthase